MKRMFQVMVWIVILATMLPAQTASGTAELSRLLNEFLDGASRNDAAIHDKFWADDLIYTGSGGTRRGKPEIMKDVRSSPAPKPGDPKTIFSAEDIRIRNTATPRSSPFASSARLLPSPPMATR